MEACLSSRSAERIADGSGLRFSSFLRLYPEGDRKSGGIFRRMFSAVGQPGGRKKIAQRFIAGYAVTVGQVPEGRQKACPPKRCRIESMHFCPCGTRSTSSGGPAMNCGAILGRPSGTSSLRLRSPSTRLRARLAIGPCSQKRDDRHQE